MPSKQENDVINESVITLNIAYNPPLDWDGCLAYYEKHKIGDLESFVNNTYTRTFVFNNKIGVICICNNDKENHLEIRIKTEDSNSVDFVLERIKKMFDLLLDPVHVSKAFQAIPSLRRIQFIKGTRLVGCWDNFELAVTAILGQLVSIKQATGLVSQLLNLYGERKINSFTQREDILFPSPEILANESLSELRIPQMKKKAIVALSKMVLDGQIDLYNGQDPLVLKQKLMQIYGIGKWTAGYIALRAMGDADAFPEGDVFLEKITSKKDISALSPWRGYLASYLYKYGVK